MGMRDDNSEHSRKPFFYYYTIVMIVLMALNLVLMPFMQGRQVTEVPYSTFLEMIDDGNVLQVARNEDQIDFLAKTGRQNRFGEDEVAQYKTGPWPDDTLTQKLLDHDVVFAEEIVEQPSMIMTLLFQWVIPILIFVVIGQLMARYMQKKMGGPNAMTFGKSNAKIYAESETGKTFADVAGQEEANDALKEIVDFLHHP